MATSESRTFTVPDYMVGRRRLVLSTDAKNEAGDQYAVVHDFLSPILDARDRAGHFGTDRGRASMQQSRAEIDLLLNLMQMTGRVPVADGSPVALVDEQTVRDSRGARLILQEARREDGTLFVVAIGPLTDVASAILLDRKVIEQHMIVVSVGGAPQGDPVREPLARRHTGDLTG